MDYQIVIETCCEILLVSFPFALVFMICQKIINIVIRFVFGKEVKF